MSVGAGPSPVLSRCCLVSIRCCRPCVPGHQMICQPGDGLHGSRSGSRKLAPSASPEEQLLLRGAATPLLRLGDRRDELGAPPPGHQVAGRPAGGVEFPAAGAGTRTASGRWDVRKRIRYRCGGIALGRAGGDCRRRQPPGRGTLGAFALLASACLLIEPEVVRSTSLYPSRRVDSPPRSASRRSGRAVEDETCVVSCAE